MFWKSILSILSLNIVFPVQAVLAQDVQSLLACGDDQIRLYQGENSDLKQVWRWTASSSIDLPMRYREKFLARIDECKPVEQGQLILATSSTGGVVLIDRKSGKSIFYAYAPMAHSADLLPDGRIAVALSKHQDGNRLEIYDRKTNERSLFHLPLYSGHGVVWDSARETLFALSHDMIQAFRLKNWESAAPELEETSRWTLPGLRNGHDLSHDEERNDYIVSTEDGVWRFSPERSSFEPISFLNPADNVKAVTVKRKNIAWVQAEDSWWAYGFTLTDQNGMSQQRISVENMHLYKVRWYHR